jgi:serine/threonine protein kinase
MPSLFIDGVAAPDEIKAQLRALSSDIDFQKEIAKGGNGYVFFGENKILKVHVAVKFYYWGGDPDFHAEPGTLATINSPNILSVNNAGLIDGEWAYFVTPYCLHGDLDDIIDRTMQGNCLAVDRTCQLLMGVGALHEQRFLHRDLKPANIYVGENNESIIGDFGSIKYMPDAVSSIPASSHAVLYRPPESIKTNSYGFSGDIYQCGIVLYQLLGGNLPYNEVSWLTKAERRKYNEFSTNADKAIFADQCVKARIVKGRILDIGSLPSWVPENLRRIIRKATHKDPQKRFASASAFHVDLNNIRPNIPDWGIEDGCPTKNGSTRYRISQRNGEFFVHKMKNNNVWRRDNSIAGNSVPLLVAAINERA